MRSHATRPQHRKHRTLSVSSPSGRRHRSVPHRHRPCTSIRSHGRHRRDCRTPEWDARAMPARRARTMPEEREPWIRRPDFRDAEGPCPLPILVDSSASVHRCARRYTPPDRHHSDMSGSDVPSQPKTHGSTGRPMAQWRSAAHPAQQHRTTCRRTTGRHTANGNRSSRATRLDCVCRGSFHAICGNAQTPTDIRAYRHRRAKLQGDTWAILSPRRNSFRTGGEPPCVRRRGVMRARTVAPGRGSMTRSPARLP